MTDLKYFHHIHPLPHSPLLQDILHGDPVVLVLHDGPVDLLGAGLDVRQHPVDRQYDVVDELDLVARDEGLLPVHALQGLVAHGLLQVSLGEELGVDELKIIQLTHMKIFQ